MRNTHKGLFGPAALCRLDDDLLASMRTPSQSPRVLASCLVCLLIGSAVFGAAFGIWRAPLQAGMSAVKMPLLMLSTTAFSALINALMAQTLGARLSFRQTLACMLLAFAVTSAVLASLAPIDAFFAWQMPGPETPEAMVSYRTILVMNTAVVGAAGMLGNLHLYRVLAALTGSRRMAARVLTAWILATGLVGCELSWVMSPFLCRPDKALHILNPNAFDNNFFEYLFQTITGHLP